MGCDVGKSVRLWRFRLGLKISGTSIKGCNRHMGAVHDVNTFYPWDEREHGWGKVLEKECFSPDVFMGRANDEPIFHYPTLVAELDEAFRNGCGPFPLGVSKFDLCTKLLLAKRWGSWEKLE